MLTIRSDSLEPRPPQSVLVQVLRQPLDRPGSGPTACQSLAKIIDQPTSVMTIHPSGGRLTPHAHADDCAYNNMSQSSSLLIVCLLNQLSADQPPRSVNRFHLNSKLAYSSTQLPLLLYSQPFIMLPQPNRDQALLQSFLGDLAKSCFWSTLIRPLVFLVLTFQLRHSYQFDCSSAKLLNHLELLFHKSSNQIGASLPAPSPKSLKSIRASLAPRRFRSARGFKCSTLVDPSDSSILHQHCPSPSHLLRSNLNPSRPLSRAGIFIPSSSKRISPLELQRHAARAQSQMQRSAFCPAEDSLDGDQRHLRYYFVNAYREKLFSPCTPVIPTFSPPSTWQCVATGIDDDEELEPLEDLLDWDSSTRLN